MNTFQKISLLYLFSAAVGLSFSPNAVAAPEDFDSPTTAADLRGPDVDSDLFAPDDEDGENY
ncbi:MAG: hypothetical protein LBF84_03855 [Holosporales bacterium]|jgi:hypothetical protein|nr:hypothetical protein [Holosporales bacterium]